MNNCLRHFDSVSTDYSKRGESGWWKYLREWEWRAIESFLPCGPLGEILELGCGTGHCTRRLSKKEIRRFVVVDFSQKMLNEVNDVACRKVLADIEDYQDGNSYDLILCAGALEFVLKPQHVFKNISAMLKPDGVFLLLAPRYSLAGFVYKLYHRFHSVSVCLFTREGLIHDAALAGLKLLYSRAVFPLSLVAVFHKTQEYT